MTSNAGWAYHLTKMSMQYDLYSGVSLFGLYLAHWADGLCSSLAGTYRARFARRDGLSVVLPVESVLTEKRRRIRDLERIIAQSEAAQRGGSVFSREERDLALLGLRLLNKDVGQYGKTFKD